jgi:hypothetical protein
MIGVVVESGGSGGSGIYQTDGGVR